MSITQGIVRRMLWELAISTKYSYKDLLWLYNNTTRIDEFLFLFELVNRSGVEFDKVVNIGTYIEDDNGTALITYLNGEEETVKL